MASTTTKLSLRKPAPTDAVDVTADLANNFDVLDTAVGTTVCTSGTRPSVPFIGQSIRETDTGLHYTWDGSAWQLTTRCATVCTSTTRPTSTFTGLLIYETDTLLVYVWTGAAWVLYPRGLTVCTSTSRPAAPTTGTLIYETDSFDLVLWVGTWVVLERAYIYGGKDVVHTNTLTATGNNQTEILINNMDSGAIDLIANTRYRITVRWTATPSGTVGTTMTTVTSFMMRIRDTNVSGAIRAEQRVEVPTVVAGTVLHGEFSATYETTAAESAKTWVFTCQRLVGTITCVLTFTGDGTAARRGMEVINLGHSGQLTQVTT